jgi:hypothetical protein
MVAVKRRFELGRSQALPMIEGILFSKTFGTQNLFHNLGLIMG